MEISFRESMNFFMESILHFKTFGVSFIALISSLSLSLEMFSFSCAIYLEVKGGPLRNHRFGVGQWPLVAWPNLSSIPGTGPLLGFYSTSPFNNSEGGYLKPSTLLGRNFFNSLAFFWQFF